MRESVLFSAVLFNAATGQCGPRPPVTRFSKSSYTFVSRYIRPRDSVVGIVTSPRAWWSMARLPVREGLLFSETFRPTVRSTQPPV
jgi:hypothetical protein